MTSKDVKRTIVSQQKCICYYLLLDINDILIFYQNNM